MAQPKTKSNATFIAAVAVITCLHLACVLSQRLYPFVDLPNHLAGATIYRYAGNGGNEFAHYFTVDALLRPNTFHLLFCGARVFPSVEVANTVFYALYVILLPVSVLVLIRQLGGNRWLTLLCFPLMYNFNVCWGFVGFTFSLPLALLLMAAMFHAFQHDRTRSKILLAAGFLLLYFVHVLTTLLCLLVFACLLAGRLRRSAASAMRHAAAALPVVALLAVWWLAFAEHSEEGIFGFLARYYTRNYARTVHLRAGLLCYDNYFLYPGRAGKLLGSAFGLTFLASLAAMLVLRRKHLRETWRHTRAPAAVLLVLVSLACGLFLPDHLPGQSILYERFAVFFLASVAVLCGVLAPRRLPVPAVMALAAVCLIHLALWGGYFLDFSRRTRGFTRGLLPAGAPGRKLAALIYDHDFRGKPAFIHFQNYYIIWKKGIAPTSIVDYRFGAVRRAVGRETLPKHRDYNTLRRDLALDRDPGYADVDYLLVRGELPPQVRRYLPGFEPARQTGKWWLYVNRRNVAASRPAGATTAPAGAAAGE
jgi:hypothetical protein